jgi:hypothetical protein
LAAGLENFLARETDQANDPRAKQQQTGGLGHTGQIIGKEITPTGDTGDGQNSRVLTAGGVTAGGSATSTAEIFNPITNSWSPIGVGMNEARSGATAALLQDGRVLIAGGQNGTTISSTVEIFDPSLATFNAAGMMSSPHTQHAMALLHDGRVVIVGGFNGSAPLASTDVLGPVAGTVSTGPALVTARYGHTATTLLNGAVVVIGGNNGNADPAQMDATATELVDFTAATPAFATLATNLATPREGHIALLLPNNNGVLIIGGTSGGTAIASAELFTVQDSAQGAWTYGFAPTGAMTTARSAWLAQQTRSTCLARRCSATALSPWRAEWMQTVTR